MYVHMYMYTCVCLYVCMYVCVYVCECVFTCVCGVCMYLYVTHVCMYVCVYVGTCTSYICIYMYIIYMCTQTLPPTGIRSRGQSWPSTRRAQRCVYPSGIVSSHTGLPLPRTPPPKAYSHALPPQRYLLINTILAFNTPGAEVSIPPRYSLTRVMG